MSFVQFLLCWSLSLVANLSPIGKCIFFLLTHELFLSFPLDFPAVSAKQLDLGAECGEVYLTYLKITGSNS